jgi:hypothetical protein
MKTPTIKKIKAAGKAVGCEIERSGWYNGHPAYQVKNEDRTRLMTNHDMVERYMRGDLF